MAVPQESWSREFVEESVLADLAAAAPSTASLEPAGDNNSTSPSPADPGSSDAVETIPLSPAVLDLVEQYQQAAADAEGSSSDSAVRQPGKASSSRSSSNAGTTNSKKSKAAAAAVVQDAAASTSMPPELQGTVQQVQTMYGQLLQDNYVEVEDADVAAFSLKLLQELSRLVQAAAAAQQDDDEGLCQLCEREMPLTKHDDTKGCSQGLQEAWHELFRAAGWRDGVPALPQRHTQGSARQQGVGAALQDTGGPEAAQGHLQLCAVGQAAADHQQGGRGVGALQVPALIRTAYTPDECAGRKPGVCRS